MLQNEDVGIPPKMGRKRKCHKEIQKRTEKGTGEESPPGGIRMVPRKSETYKGKVSSKEKI